MANQIFSRSQRLLSTVNNSKPVLIDFFYDVVSPYSWFAFETLLRYRPLWNIDLVLRPVLIGGVSRATGNSAPMLVPAKAKYMQNDVVMNAKYFDVPAKLMDSEMLVTVILEKTSLVPMRHLTAVQQLLPGKLENVSRALWMQFWNQGRDFTLPEVMADACAAAGLSTAETEAVAKRATSPEVKAALRSNTDEAVEAGAFGMPTMVVHRSPEERLMFFGSDRIPLLAYQIGETWSGPVPGRAPPAKL